MLEHPILELLRQVNPRHNAYDLWELTTLYQEVQGNAYWLVDLDPTLGIPANVWPLPSHLVKPVREKLSSQLVDYYEYRVQGHVTRYTPDQVIHFSYPDPRDPYLGGLSPLRAAFESAALSSQFLTLESHAPTDEEVRKNPAWAGIRRVVTRWLLLEYACTALPCNPATITEAVSKGLVTLPEPVQEVLGWKELLTRAPASETLVSFTALDQVQAHLERRLAAQDLEALGKKAWQLAYDKVRGRI